ncbi:MAG TPA: Holliday junction branch migration protein RuvA [Frankiaceae bacterium]|nr:Holliday junction branch migration protein RuvA [Frankiaceae bacterium]
MIASVSGRVAAVAPDQAVIEVGGVGLAVSCAPATLAALRVGEQATLATALIVRETELTLYGFADADEKEVFEALQTAAGVGPRLAQAALAVLRPDDVRRAVATEDLNALIKVPGIGKKGAQRIVLDLKDRLCPPVGSGDGTVPVPRAEQWQDQLRAALTGLGYGLREADEAVTAVEPLVSDPPSVPVLLRQALAMLRPQ